MHSEWYLLVIYVWWCVILKCFECSKYVVSNIKVASQYRFLSIVWVSWEILFVRLAGQLDFRGFDQTVDTDGLTVDTDGLLKHMVRSTLLHFLGLRVPTGKISNFSEMCFRGSESCIQNDICLWFCVWWFVILKCFKCSKYVVSNIKVASQYRFLKSWQ